MRIGLIAMSGIRAASEELNKVGLTLPGVVERSQVIASMPSLGLLTLAALTPPEFELSYHEIADLRREPALPDGFDLVAIASFSGQIFDAYAVADQYRARGVPVVLGGLHVSRLPEEAAEHCDAVVIGEGELSWPRLLADWKAGRLQPRYAPIPGEEFDLANAPMPRYELLDMPRYNRITVQTTRGCPHACEFCASSILLTPGYKRKPAAKVMAEIRRVRELWPKPFIEFADDNSFVDKRHAREILQALSADPVPWFTEADISIAEDPGLLDLVRASGCRQLLIGLESPTGAGLDGIERRTNWKLRQLDRYEAGVRRIQAHGVTVNGCFILGLDGDTEAAFDAIYDFVARTNLFEVQITVLTPFPGTPLYHRLLQAGRIIDPGAWNKCTLFDVNFVPQNVSPQRLQQGLVDLAKRLYHPDFVHDRRERYIDELRRNGLRPPLGMVREPVAN